MVARAAVLFAVLGATAASAADLYVAPRGDDAQAGTREAPLATLAGARQAIRNRKRSGALQEPWTVHVAPGTYYLSAPV